MISPSPPPRSSLPSWVWACTFCAILPLLIIALVGVLALPHLRGIRQTARARHYSEVCLENLQQSSQALQMYVQDYDNHYPQKTNWMDATYLYVKDQKIYQCPAVKAKYPAKAKNLTVNGYAFNSKLSGKEVKKITTPALTEMVYDSSNLSRNASDPFTSLPDPARHIYRDLSSSSPHRDQITNMVSYADGHAKSFP